MNNFFVSKNLLYYFAFLLLVLVSWTNPDDLPPTSLRIIYLFVLMVPTMLWAPKVMPIVITLFYIVSNYSCYISYMPNQVVLYVLFPLVAILNNSSTQSNRIPFIFILLMLYTLVVNMCGAASFEPITACLILMMMFVKLAPVKDNHYVHLFSYTLILSSLILGLQFIIEGKQFQQSVGYGDFDSRTQWMDPNYFGCVVGIGAITALIEALLNNTLSKKIRYLFFAIYVFLCVILIINASRGALLAVLCSSVIILFLSDISVKIKVSALICIVSFLYVMYIYGVFDFLLLRMELDEGHGGSGRTEIWARKIEAYSQLGLSDQLFGVGYQNGMRLEYNYLIGFHNDYIAFLVEYGICGLIAYISFMFSILKNAKNFWIVFAIVVYVVIAGATLEPISGGMLAFFSFLFYGKLIAQTDDFRKTPSLAR